MPPTLRIISRTATPSSEIARWVLDHRGIPYGEETGVGDGPVVTAAEGPLNGIRAVVDYFEARCREDARLVPAGKRPEVMALFDDIVRGGVRSVEARAGDGRRYLVGDTFTLADVAYAAHAPDSVFGKRMYQQHRGTRTAFVESANKSSFGSRLTAKLTGTKVIRPVLNFVRRIMPVLSFGTKALATSHAAVTDILGRDTDFTIKPINAPRIDRLDGPFILGMDRGPEYDREEAALRKAVRKTDLELVRTQAAARAAELIEAARPIGRIDVVGSYARLVAARTVANYFGVPGPNEPALMRWMRAAFQDVFLNVGNDPAITAAAAAAGKELRAFEDALISAREANAGDGDDILTRLVRMEGEGGWLDHDGVRRNLGGMIVGAVDTTSKFVALAMNQLIDRPKELAETRAAANAGDMERVRKYTYEAVRFDPHNAFLLRHAARDTKVGRTRIKGGSAVLVSVLSAMFDPAAYPEPNEFRTDRPGYIHFGYGMHTCFGERINDVQIPELVGGLARLPGLRRARGSSGHIAWDGPFPEHLVLAFDA
jgi:cytochrome P450